MPRLKFACLVIHTRKGHIDLKTILKLIEAFVGCQGHNKKSLSKSFRYNKNSFLCSHYVFLLYGHVGGYAWVVQKRYIFWVLWLNSVFSLAQSIQLDTMKLHRILWGGVRFHLLLCYYIALWGITEVMTFDIVFSSSSLLHATLHVIINFHCFANFPFHLIETYHHKRLGLFRVKRPHKKSEKSKLFWTFESLKDKVHLSLSKLCTVVLGGPSLLAFIPNLPVRRW